MSEKNKELWKLLSVPIPKQHLKKTNLPHITDIDSTYDWTILTEICGPFGNEDTWGYDYRPEDMDVREYQSAKGRKMYLCIIKRVRCWLNFNGKKCEGYVPGGGDSDDAGYAMKGAITSAFGKFVAYFGRGIEIYSGGASNCKRAEREPGDDGLADIKAGAQATSDGGETIDTAHARALHKSFGVKYKGKTEAGIIAIHAAMTMFGYQPDEKGNFHFSQIKKADFEKIKETLLGDENAESK